MDPAKRSAYNRNYYAKHKAQIKKAIKKYETNNIEFVRARRKVYQTRYRDKNIESFRKKRRDVYRNNTYGSKDTQKAYYIKNRDKILAYKKNRYNTNEKVRNACLAKQKEIYKTRYWGNDRFIDYSV